MIAHRGGDKGQLAAAVERWLLQLPHLAYLLMLGERSDPPCKRKPAVSTIETVHLHHHMADWSIPSSVSLIRLRCFVPGAWSGLAKACLH